MQRSKTLRALGAALAVTLLATACSSDGDGGDDDGTAVDQSPDAGESPGGEESPDGTAAGDYCEGGEERDLVWAHEQEPGPDMHLDDPENNLSITSWIQQSMLEGLFGHTADLGFFPELLADTPTPEPTDAGGMTVDFVLRDGLTWSDGTPFTAQQVSDFYDLIMEGVDPETGEGGVLPYSDRANYLSIESIEVASDTEFTITWSEPFSGWQTIFARIYPTHLIDSAEAANEALREWQIDGEVLPSTGPMVFDTWDRGSSMHLVRNDSYHGSNSPDVDNDGIACVTGVRIDFVADTDTQVNALLGEEADFIFAQPQTQFGERIATDDRFALASEAGPAWEHWGFNLHNAHLGDLAVREAIAMAMDKADVVETLYTPIYGEGVVAPEGLGNGHWMANQAAYVNHQGDAGYGQGDVEAAAALLEGAGYSLNGDGIYEHPDRGVLSLRVGTTGGNALRELQQQIIQEQLIAAGIEITIDNVPGADYFSERPFAADSIACSTSGGTEGDCNLWDITQFAWVGGPWPGSGFVSFETGSGNNPYGYANEEYDAAANDCRVAIDPDEFADCINRADSLVTLPTGDTGMIVVPLTQKPNFYTYNNVRLAGAGAVPDTNDAGPLQNVVDYKPAAG